MGKGSYLGGSTIVKGPHPRRRRGSSKAAGGGALERWRAEFEARDPLDVRHVPADEVRRQADKKARDRKAALASSATKLPKARKRRKTKKARKANDAPTTQT